MPESPQPDVIRNSDARRLFLHLQGLARPPRARLDRAGLRDLIEHLGFVQIDSIQTVARAHHQILFSRNWTYRPEDLRALQEDDRAVFENWTHDASVIPTVFYPYWQDRFARARDDLRSRWRKWRRSGFEALIDDVRDRIARDGPTMARDLRPNGAGPRRKTADSTWWDWHPAKTALEYLWRTGDIAIARRQGFQKVYDLTERVIPVTHRTRAVSRQKTVHWACATALDRLGFATPGEIARFWGAVSPQEAANWCAARLGDELTQVAIESANGGKPRVHVAHADYRERLEAAAPLPSSLRVLSPFDPVLRDRDRCERLFDFHYRIEVFVPAAKRQYGYYVFPLLEGGRFVGRIDMIHQSQQSNLRVKRLWLEPKVRLTPARQRKLEAELDRIRRFVGADRVVFDKGYDRACR